MAMNWPTFFKRLLSAVFFTAFMLIGMLIKHPFAIIIMTLIIHYLCVKEWHSLFNNILIQKDKKVIPKAFQWLHHFLGLVLLYLLWFTALPAVIPLLVLVGLCLASFFVFKNNKSAQLFIGLLYISFPLSFLFILQQTYFFLPLIIILFIWTNDTMAYISGSFIGRTPFSKISPNKTWEGIIGGVLFTIFLAFLIAHFSWFAYNGAKLELLVLAFLTSIASILGDLMESKLKRIAKVKDSGNILPGHGGALDRFDSMLFALPTIFFYYYYFIA